MLNFMMIEDIRQRVAHTCAHSRHIAAEPPGKGVERIVDSEVKDGDYLHG